MKRLYLVIFALVLLANTAPLLATCSQASPMNCPEYMAVACHPDAVGSGSTEGATFASAAVYDASHNVLDQQSVSCDELGGGGGDCVLHWWLCEGPFAF